MQYGTLMQKTLALLEGRNDLTTIAAQTGLPFFWLRRFKLREFNDPGVNRIQKLYEHLSGEKLLKD